MAKKNHNEKAMPSAKLLYDKELEKKVKPVTTVRLKTKDSWVVGKIGITRKLTRREEQLQKRNLKTKNLAGL